MAEKEKDKKNKEEEEEKESKPKSGGVMKTVLMIGLPLMVVQTGVAYFLISKLVKVPQAAEQIEEPEVKEEEEEGPAKLFVVEDVIINPAGTSGARFLNSTIALEYTAPELEQELTEKEVQIRDVLINVLASKTIPELDGPEDREALKQEILEKCNAILKNGKIKRVYFSNFIMQ